MSPTRIGGSGPSGARLLAGPQRRDRRRGCPRRRRWQASVPTAPATACHQRPADRSDVPRAADDGREGRHSTLADERAGHRCEFPPGRRRRSTRPCATYRRRRASAAGTPATVDVASPTARTPSRPPSACAVERAGRDRRRRSRRRRPRRDRREVPRRGRPRSPSRPAPPRRRTSTTVGRCGRARCRSRSTSSARTVIVAIRCGGLPARPTQTSIVGGRPITVGHGSRRVPCSGDPLAVSGRERARQPGRPLGADRRRQSPPRPPAGGRLQAVGAGVPTSRHIASTASSSNADGRRRGW